VPAGVLGEIYRAERARRLERIELFKLGRALKRRTEGNGSEPTWLVDARMAYDELGAMLDTLFPPLG
jgi:hypothetical protein